MPQGSENDLLDVRFYTEATPVVYNRDNEPFFDLNTNILLVDNKAILAKTTALTTEADLAAHIGASGVSEHATATTTSAGFMSAADKAKLDSVQAEAQLNIIAPVDAIGLISRGITTLHSHLLATPLSDGFMSAADKAKLDSVETGAQVNNLSTSEATQLTTGVNADALHTHFFSAGVETFTEAVHATTDHTGLPGVSGFPGFSADEYNLGPIISGAGMPGATDTETFIVPFPFATLDVITCGMTHLLDTGYWGGSESFKITDITKIGTSGSVTYTVFGGDTYMAVWMGGYGTI